MAANGWDKLGLNRDPLADGPIAWHFSRPADQAQFDYLSHLVAFSGLLLVVTGEKACGKTRHARLLQDQLRQQFKVLAMTVGAKLSLKQLTQGLVAELGLDAQGADSLPALVKQLSERHWPQEPVLLLDSAELLTDDVLRFLLDLTAAQQSVEQGLALILYGQDELVVRLASLRNDASRLLYHWQFPLFQASELKDYLWIRLQRAGWQGPWPISEQQWQSWSLCCRGSPGLLALHAPALQHLLLVARKPEAFSIVGRLKGYWHKRGKDWFMLILTLVLIVPLLLLQDEINGLFSDNKLPAKTRSQLSAPSASTRLSVIPETRLAPPTAQISPLISAEPLPPLMNEAKVKALELNQPTAKAIQPEPKALFTEQEQQILLLDPESYVVWLDSGPMASLERWQNNEHQSRVYQMPELGVWAMVWGSFSSRSKAQQALKLWSKELPNLSPQVRKSSQIQAELRKAKSL